MTHPKDSDATAPPPPNTTDPITPTEPPATPPKPLSADEQMALYEKDLKENDWGHQPC